MAGVRVEALLDQMDALWGQEGRVVGAEVALAGLGAALAAWAPGPGRHTIWQLVNHLTFWKEVCAGALTGAPRPPGPIVNTETWAPFGRGRLARDSGPVPGSPQSPAGPGGGPLRC